MEESRAFVDNTIDMRAVDYDYCGNSTVSNCHNGYVVLDNKKDCFISYEKINFDVSKIAGFEVEAATPYAVGFIEIRIDSINNNPIGICQVTNSGGWFNWGIFMTDLYCEAGVHTLFLNFKGPDGAELQVRSFRLIREYLFDKKKLGNYCLPEPVPYMGPMEKNFIGSDTAGAGGDVNGVWDFLIGPDYTSINYLNSEELRIEIDDEEFSLDLKMHRAKGTGMFYGIQRIADIEVTVIDFTNMGQPWVSRFIMMDNKSTNKSHIMKVKAYINPTAPAKLIKDAAVQLLAQKDVLIAETAKNLNWAERCVTIAFNNYSRGTFIGGSYVLQSIPQTVLPGGNFSTSLYHYTHLLEENKIDQEYVDFINKRNPIEDYERCVREWKEWLSTGTGFNIPDKRIKDIIEGTLVLTKMQQNRDGGFMATARVYALSYLRDSHGALRGLLAAGYIEEARKYILCEHHKYKVFKHVPNAVEMGNDAYAHDFGEAENHAAETPAYYVLCLRNYYENTGDMDLLIQVEESIKSSIDLQLKYAEMNEWKLPFNGDETEQFTIKADGEIWGGFGNIEDWNIKNWSMASLAACAASVEFYVKYLKLRGCNQAAEVYKEKLNNIMDAIDENFWRDELNIYDWERKRDGSYSSYRVPNFSMLPFWLKTPIRDSSRAVSNIASISDYIRPNGYIPTQPGAVEGMCGHNLGYLLYNLVKTNHPKKDEVYNTLIYGGTVSCWGTWSEYYGPNGMGNTRNMRIFESNINMEAILAYWGLVK